MGRYVYVRERKTKAGQKGWWPEKKKIEAVTAWMSSGSLPIASATTGVPLETIRTWRRMPWWKEFEQQIKDEDNQELDAKFSGIVRKTLNVIEDRIENGNFQLDPKTGRVIRVPVNLRDTHRVMSDLVDKRKVIRNEPTKITSGDGVNDRLVKLAAQFAEFALGNKNTEMKQVGPVYEGDWEESNDALYAEREAGLQTGERAVQQQHGTEEETCTTECSEADNGSQGSS